MSTSEITATHRLADALLGEGGLEQYVRERRQAGKSWRKITLDLRDDIALDLTYETLRGWFGDRDWATPPSRKTTAPRNRRPGLGHRPGRSRPQSARTGEQLSVD